MFQIHQEEQKVLLEAYYSLKHFLWSVASFLRAHCIIYEKQSSLIDTQFLSVHSKWDWIIKKKYDWNAWNKQQWDASPPIFDETAGEGFKKAKKKKKEKLAAFSSIPHI